MVSCCCLLSSQAQVAGFLSALGSVDVASLANTAGACSVFRVLVHLRGDPVASMTTRTIIATNVTTITITIKHAVRTTAYSTTMYRDTITRPHPPVNVTRRCCNLWSSCTVGHCHATGGLSHCYTSARIHAGVVSHLVCFPFYAKIRTAPFSGAPFGSPEEGTKKRSPIVGLHFFVPTFEHRKRPPLFWTLFFVPTRFATVGS